MTPSWPTGGAVKICAGGGLTASAHPERRRPVAGGPDVRLASVLEVALYHDAAEGREMTELYEGVLGLPVVARWPGGAAHRLGDAVVLLFEREGLAEREGPIADHGTVGAGHLCFTVDAGAYEDWSRRIADAADVVH